MLESFFNKVVSKETPVFSHDFYEIFNNTLYYKTLVANLSQLSYNRWNNNIKVRHSDTRAVWKLRYSWPAGCSLSIFSANLVAIPLLCTVKNIQAKNIFESPLKIKQRFNVNKLAKKHNEDSVQWYFTKHFLELTYHFSSKSKGRILDELCVSLNVLLTIVNTSHFYINYPFILPLFYITFHIRTV